MEQSCLAVLVASVGGTISEHATAARRGGDYFAAWVMDAVGSWAAEAAADALMDRLKRHLGGNEALTLRYSPGYCGMDVTQQDQLFHLVQADSVGVKLLPSRLMYPLKSISGIVGLGPKKQITNYRCACDQCARVGCHVRR
jgi:cobalamin-dependent methionine synthase I